ncbi:G-alpha-domain-containing protein [Guyanagaster necrorhizus]|uniref:G-alpha-domain-containing protein n=1 Tax=Guyanagaster necrorhizus TaxID=856835 RepID=A0A9P7VXW8_9AGAR|nr:G-alpha-domain-containing protein [Guyanagaster necrorhizus MCA 3950]KAG7449581.1 G-alpha-domain-containing protein [Guyanagaster necrorhizus MCA 3950]
MSSLKSSIYPDGDPLAVVTAPPPDESPSERDERLSNEKAAQKRSDAIDEEIARQRIAEKKAPKVVKVLLLGQSESGKSTTLKNFQLINSPKAFRQERASWRAVVQLNVARSIRIILDIMSQAHAQQTQKQHPVASSSMSSFESLQRPDVVYPTLTAEHLKLKMRLKPLLQVEEALLRRLSPGNTAEFEATQLTVPTSLPYPDRNYKEPSVNSAVHWKGAFGRLLTPNEQRTSFDSEQGIDFDDPKDPGLVLHNCREDMDHLWNDPTVKELLKVHKLRLEDLSGFFLDSLDRVTALKYVPSDDDILRARIKTLGVSEHRFRLKADTGNMVSHDWRVFDVGGARSLVRAAWAPYFDDMDAIIFLAPLSCFDQVLAEDSSVNRLEDSMSLWKSIVSNQLLKNTDLILFLNKCDILKAKLESGIRFGTWVISYGDRPNTFEGAANYMKKKFAGSFKSNSPEPRPFYCHFTSVTDVKSTTHILENVKDTVVRKNLQDSNMV